MDLLGMFFRNEYFSNMKFRFGCKMLKLRKSIYWGCFREMNTFFGRHMKFKFGYKILKLGEEYWGRGVKGVFKE